MKAVLDEQAGKVTFILTRNSDLATEFFKSIFPLYKAKPTLEDIDVELRPLIKSMWDEGYKTLTCCSGHREKPGYIIFRRRRGRLWQNIFWEPGTCIPSNVSEVVPTSGFGVTGLEIDIKLSKRRLKRIKVILKKKSS